LAKTCSFFVADYDRPYGERLRQFVEKIAVSGRT